MIRDKFWKKMRTVQRLHRLLYAVGLGPVIGRLILLLTTTGRRTGRKRVTPLQYEVIDGQYYLGSARGVKADWYCNLAADPRVEVRVKNRCFTGQAETVCDPERIADFLEIRLQRHPRMMGMLMQRAHGLPAHPGRSALVELASKEAMVIIRPLEEIDRHKRATRRVG
jgi:deazaflavin-dependent oxidoreductase (nitroreductase family)